MNKIKLRAISDIQTGPFGMQLHKDEYTSSGVLMLNAKNIGHGNIITDSVDYVSQETADRLSKYKLKYGDIVLGRAGSIDKHVYINREYANSFQGTNCIRIRCNDLQISSYVAYYLWLPQIKHKIENSSGGSVQSYITSDFLKELTVELPHVEEIKKVSNLLSTLDQKISVNKKINDNLQQMAYDVYMHRFFKKQANGKLADILLENTKSSIQVRDAKEANGSYPFFTSGDAILNWHNGIVNGRNCYLNTGGNADVKFYIGDAAYSTDTWSISAKDEMADYLYLFLLSIKPELNLKFFQGTGLKHLQKPLLKARLIYIPDSDEILNFNNYVQLWHNLISKNVIENQQLSHIRDWILPMLMNGQATIKD